MDEYIEREAAYKTIMGEPPDAHYPQWYADKILSIPVADVAPVRHGRWVNDKQSKFKYRYNCSACNYRLIDKPCNYCPNCGAKMDGEQ